MLLVRSGLWFALMSLALALGCGDDTTEPPGGVEITVVVATGKVPVLNVDYTISCFGEVDDSADDVQLEGGFSRLDDLPGLGGEATGESGFFDLPIGACLIQLRGRAADGEVLCTSEESFSVTETTDQANFLLFCGGGTTPLPPEPSSNICPDLSPVDCVSAEPGTSRTACDVSFRDEDGTCDAACDPQTCSVTPSGLSCTPGPDPGVSASVTCDQDVLFCVGDGVADPSCTFRVSGERFVVDCALMGGETLAGTTVTCTVVVTDGDVDCDRSEVVEIACPASDL